MTGRGKSKSHSPQHGAVSQDEIITMLSARVKELSDLRAASVKYPLLRKLLAATVKDLPAGTRLPGIRDLADCLGISLVTAQKAVRELTEEGILYSRPRAGVFVSQSGTEHSAQAADSLPTTAARHPFRVGFDFGTDSTAAYQREFWEEIVELFAKQHPNSHPYLHFEAEITNRARTLDVLERYGWHRIHEDRSNENLNLADFAGALLPVAPSPDGLLPLYHRTYFLFFNRSVLERHKLPLPDYRTFAEQTAYLSELSPKLSRLGLDSRPFSIQEPVTLFGGYISHLHEFFNSDTPRATLREQLIETTEKLMEFCRLCRYSVKNQDDWIEARNEFLRGESPFFLGYSVDYWEFSRKQLPFSLGAYPTLCCDDALFLWTRVGAVSRFSEHPVESINFLLFLLRPEIQERFGATGNFGAALDDRYHPEMDADSDWLSETLRHSQPFQLTTRELYYMTITVFGGEIWRSLLDQSSATEILDRSLQLGRSYLQHRSGRLANGIA